MTDYEQHLKNWYEEALAAASTQLEKDKVTAQYKMQIAAFLAKK